MEQLHWPDEVFGETDGWSCHGPLDIPLSPMVAQPELPLAEPLTTLCSCGFPLYVAEHGPYCLLDNGPVPVVVPGKESTQINQRGA